jgi:phosphonate transport system permease protein
MGENIQTAVMPNKIYAKDIVRQRGDKIQTGNLKNDLPIILFLLISAVLTVLSFVFLQLDWSKVVSRLPRLWSVLYDLSRFSLERFELTVSTFTETVTVTVLATIYGCIFGLIIGALAARNITPFKPLSTILQAFLAFIRAVPTVVWVLLILVCLGFGMAAGIVGLCFHVTAFFGRTFAQTFEEVPPSAIEALRAAGANRIQIFFGAILPASFTGLMAWLALRFEITFSEAAILGMVGAGGIGYTIMAAMNSYKFGRAGLAVVIIFAFSYIVEILVSAIKRRMKV